MERPRQESLRSHDPTLHFQFDHWFTWTLRNLLNISVWMHLTLLIKKENKKYFLYMSFKLVHLFPLQSLQSHVTKKSSSQPAPIPTLIFSWAVRGGLSDHLDPKDSKNLPQFTLTLLLLHFGKRITPAFQQKFSWLFTLNCKTSMKFGTHRFRRVSPFFPEHLPLNCCWTQQIHECFQLGSLV